MDIKSEVFEKVQKIKVTMDDGEEYASIEAVAAAFGISADYLQISTYPMKDLFRMKKEISSDGTIKDVIYIPIKNLFGWLLSVDFRYVKPDARDFFFKYQAECFALIAEVPLPDEFKNIFGVDT